MSVVSEKESESTRGVVFIVAGGGFGSDRSLLEGLEQVLHVADRREVEHACLLFARPQTHV
jgi:hypothetical protein